jgi:hypothetical protein
MGLWSTLFPKAESVSAPKSTFGYGVPALDYEDEFLNKGTAQPSADVNKWTTQTTTPSATGYGQPEWMKKGEDPKTQPPSGAAKPAATVEQKTSVPYGYNRPAITYSEMSPKAETATVTTGRSPAQEAAVKTAITTRAAPASHVTPPVPDNPAESATGQSNTFVPESVPDPGGVMVVGDYGIGNKPSIDITKTGTPDAAPYKVKTNAPMSETERLSRLADRLNNRLYYNADARIYGTSSGTAGGEGGWYKFPEMVTEDTRQQTTDRGLRELSNKSQRELESAMNKRHQNFLAELPEFAKQIYEEQIKGANQLGIDTQRWKGLESDQILFKNSLQQINDYIQNQYQRGLADLQQRYNLEGKAWDNFYTQANMALANNITLGQMAAQHGMTLEQMGYGADINKAFAQYTDLGIKAEKLNLLMQQIGSGMPAANVQVMANALGIQYAEKSDIGRLLQNAWTQRLSVIPEIEVGSTPRPPVAGGS